MRAKSILHYAKILGELLLVVVGLSPAVATAQSQPNILFILADDMGYSDIGAFGGEIQTPHLDQLARDGMVMTQFHAGAVCNVTRLQLMSGLDNNIANDPKEVTNASRTALRKDAISLGEVMRAAGYKTLMAGKWDLGQRPDQWPVARGFDQSFALLPGTASHFNEKPLDKRQPVFAEDDHQVTRLPDDYYSTRYFTDKTLEFLEHSKADKKPFFAYLAYTAPHFPLEAPQASIKKYEGLYDAGYKAIRDKRLATMKSKGMLPADFVDSPLAAGKLAWQDWPSNEEQRLEAQRMEVYAAMVDYMDGQIGRVLDYLKKTGQLDNTLIIFASDNGASDTWRQPVFAEYGKSGPDNSFANLGRPGSNIGAGPGWAWVSGAPFKGYKTMAAEGGHSVPAIAYYAGKIAPGSLTSSFATVRDLLPTFAAAAGVPVPTTVPSGGPALPIEGKSFLPMLLGQTDKGPHVGEPVVFHDENEHYVFLDNWKARSSGGKPWELYDLSKDRGELNDLARSEPQKLAQLMTAWDDNEKRITALALPR